MNDLTIGNDKIIAIAEFYAACKSQVTVQIVDPGGSPQKAAMRETKDLKETLENVLRIEPGLTNDLIESFLETFEHYDDINVQKLRATFVHGDLDWDEPQPGTRYFECGDCGHEWEEESRDAKSPSLTVCPECNSEVHPSDFELDQQTHA